MQKCDPPQIPILKPCQYDNTDSSGTYAWSQDYEIGEDGIPVIKINLELNGKPLETYFPPFFTKPAPTDQLPKEIKNRHLPFCEKDQDMLNLYSLTFAELQSFRDSARHYLTSKDRGIKKMAYRLIKAVTWIEREIYLYYLSEEKTRQLDEHEKNTMKKLAQRLLG